MGPSPVPRSTMLDSNVHANSSTSASNVPALSSGPSQELESEASSPSPAVRFASKVETISPGMSDITRPLSPPPSISKDATPSVTPDQIWDLSRSLAGANFQERSLSSFGFEPYSLPASRIHSQDDQSGAPSRQASRSTLGQSSPLPSPRLAEMQSPPLTPAGTDPAHSTDDVTGKTDRIRARNDPSAITPQASSSQGATSPMGGPEGLVRPPSDNASDPAASPDESDRDQGLPSHRRGIFSLGPQSVPVSRESSPSRPASQFYSRPLTPSGDMNDPYGANKRQPQDHKNIDPRFVFSRKKKWSPSSSYTNLAKTARNAHDQNDKRKTALGGLNKANKSNELQQNDSATPTIHSRQSSMADLKRFFKAAIGGGHGKKSSLSTTNSARSRSSATSKLVNQAPFGDDHGLTTKWGRLGKVLGSGAGGSVRLMKRSEDGTVFAVKEFRPRHSHETEKDYVKKLTAEFCIGSTLHHGNIIETLDIVSEKGKWYEVMEYAPYDLFAIVMTGKMSRAEITCCWLQILSGVTYLHSLGLAHRDLKLDNVVVSEHGIMKIIDFGSSHVFQYSFETASVPASGIVGSDPYLAPEVYGEKKYQAPGVDIWSLAIIFCCMSLRRFPWKLPRITDNSFKLFASKPTPGHDPEKLVRPQRSGDDADHHKQSENTDHGHVARNSKDNPHADDTDAQDKSITNGAPEKKELIKGPWRLLRLLPRESRHIMYRMLQIDPTKRAPMSEILEEPWVANTVICRQLAPGSIIPVDDHTHVLEPPVNAPK
ncbi:Serine/threonine-protein kinase oca2 [Zalerion maritima]|uniref:non-specific serine/threonine protein kinase n=1 Tax=Zalerion maritima TaxID=339359 RepID=A0AAD5WSH4_9PEZI|nr:Serine/threonine-protein kinase oca2 [Zalerion maritima]